MNKWFFHYLKIVTVIHAGVILVLVVVSCWHAIFRKKPDVMMPVEFMVEVPPSPPSPIESVSEPEHEPDDVPEDIPKKTTKQESKQEKKETIVRSNKKIKRPIAGKTPSKQLTPEEIKRLLALGAIVGDHTSIPDDDWQYFEMVRQTLYNAWVQPSAEEAGDAIVEVSIRLQQDGRIIDRNLVKKSGNVVMDASVMEAVNAVQQITGLSPVFLKRHKVIIVSFKVE